MKGIMISIVIPVYNTPVNYVERCIKSIAGKKDDSCEIILVDDGSRAENSEGYKCLAATYGFTYIWQQNAGVSVARNTGIDACCGEYVAFVDADDEVTPVFLEEAKSLAVQYDADFIIGGIEFYPGRTIIQGNPYVTYIGADHMYALKRAFHGCAQDYLENPVLGTPCGRIYKRTSLDTVRFPAGISHWEDQIFNRIFLNQITTVVLSPNCWYRYYQNDFSAMHAHLAGKYTEKSIPFWDIWHKMNEAEIDDILKNELRLQSISFFYAAIHQDLCQTKVKISWADKMKKMKLIAAQPIFQALTENLSIKQCVSIRDKIRFFCIKYKLYTVAFCLVKLKAAISTIKNCSL